MRARHPGRSGARVLMALGLVVACGAPAGADEWVEPPAAGRQPVRRPADALERAQALFEAGQHEAAIQAYQTAIQADPGNVEALYRLALAFQRLRRWAQAAATAERAFKVDNRHPEAQALWGHALLRMGRYPEAIWVLEGMVRLNSGRPLAPVYYDLAQACYQMKWFDRSVDYALRHLQLADTPQGHALLARSYLAQGYKDKTLAELQRSVQLYEAVEDKAR
ncbi:MAG: tetratricopeptide repeat protein [Candidatus Sericytochromatia bacterium]|nr:tetratricopeptide repeat protein [Candidatus Sericytochromatia bacterium]